MTKRSHPPIDHDPGVDAVVGRRLIEVKMGVSALRSVRNGLMELAYAMTRRPGFKALLVLPDASVTRSRLQAEWELVSAVLRPELVEGLSLCIGQEGRFIGIPSDPDSETQRILSEVVEAQRPRMDLGHAHGSAPFVVLKILFHHWLTDGRPATTDWLAKVSGYSYPTVSSVLRKLGGLIERESGRRIRLRWFSRDEFGRLLGESGRARATVRFVDRSGQPRSPEAHVRRLEQLGPPRLAIGGVLGAKHYDPDLDLAGAPRLDLSQHCPDRRLDLSFIHRLDPALKRVEDPLEPATVVVHAVRHADSLFAPRDGGLCWADPVECLLDLHEARLERQASQLLDALQRSRPSVT